MSLCGINFYSNINNRIDPVIFSLATTTDKAVRCEHIVVHPQVYRKHVHAQRNRDSAWCILPEAVHTKGVIMPYYIVYIAFIS